MYRLLYRFCFLAVLALFICCGTTPGAWAETLLYQNNFESPLYHIGDLVGQDGWNGEFETGTGTQDNPTQIIQAGGDHGQVLYNYRTGTGANRGAVHHVYRDLVATPISQGVVVLSYDALRKDLGTPSELNDNAWFFVNNDASQATSIAYWSIGNPASGKGFTVHTPPNTYTSFGNISKDQWYHLELYFRMSGAGINTYDLIARGANGAIVGSKLDIPFNATGIPLGKFHLRTFDNGSGVLVDNLRLERTVDKVRHGSFDAYQTGALVGQAGWTLGGSGGGTGTITATVAPDPSGTGKHVEVAVTSGSPARWQGMYQDLWDGGFPKSDSPPLLIFKVEGACNPAGTDMWEWFSLGNNQMSLSNPGSPQTFMPSAATFGFRRHATDVPQPRFFVMDGKGDTTWGTYYFSNVQFQYGTWYLFEAHIFPRTNTWDLLVYQRDTGQLVWDSYAQLNKHLGFGTNNIDLTRIGLYVRDTGGTFLVDNYSLIGVPEPATLGLLGLGGLLWLLGPRPWRRKRFSPEVSSPV